MRMLMLYCIRIHCGSRAGGYAYGYGGGARAGVASMGIFYC